MQLEYPIERTHENIALTKDGEAFGFYTVPYFASSVIDDKSKEDIKHKTERAVRRLFPNKNFECSLIARDFLLDEKMEELKESCHEDFKDVADRHLKERVHTFVKEAEIPSKYVWLVVVRLVKEERAMTFKELLKEGAKKRIHKFLRAFGLRQKINADWHKEWVFAESEVAQKLKSLKAVPLSSEQTYYYQRLQFLPYIPHRLDEVMETRATINVTDTMLYNSAMGRIRFVAQQGESFVSILPLGKNNGILTNNHIGEIVQNFNFPVGFKIKAQFPTIGGATGLKSKMTAGMARLKIIVKETMLSGNVLYDRIILGKHALTKMAKDVERKEPIIEYGAFLIIMASTKEDLRSRVKTAMSVCDEMGVELSRARFDQPYLFQSLLYGQKMSLVTRFWSHVTNAKGFSQLLPFTTVKCGSEIGFPIGRVDTNYHKWDTLKEALRASFNFVFYNPMLANKEGILGKVTQNLLTIITGATGSGKTVLANMIFANAILDNVKTLYIDPKRSLRKHWEKVANNPRTPADVVKIIKSINFVTLDRNNKENLGVLDPIIFLGKEDSLATARGMLYEIGKGHLSGNHITAISKAVKEIVERRQNGELVGFKHVLELLRNHEKEEVQEIGEFLFEKVDGSLLELAFSDGKTKGLSFDEHATVLEVANLELPQSNTKFEDISEDEHHSMILMNALGAFCQRFGSMNDEEATIEFIDEAWVLMKSNIGRRLVMTMKRVGRSQNNKLVIISQSVNDTKFEEDTTGAGERFCFFENGEGDNILESLGLPVTDKNRKWIQNTNQGQCVYYDVFGNINRVSVEVPPQWVPWLAPIKKDKQSQMEKRYAKI
ncbi:ATP-binding protein [Lactococcus petauri]